MALRKLIGVDHLGVVNTRANFDKLVKEIGVNYYTSVGGDKNPVVSADGWLVSSHTTQATSLWFGFPSSKFVKDSPSFSIMGMRLKFLNWGTPVLANSVAFISDLTGGVSNTSHQLLSVQDMINIHGGTAGITGVTFYIELKLNWEAGTVEVYVNDNLFRTVTINASNIATLFGQRNVMVCLTGAGGNATQRSSRDFYWIDNDPTEGPNILLGNATQVKPLTVSVTEPTNWTASTGTVNSALNTAITQGSPDTPTVTSTDMSALVANLAGVGLDGQVIHGVSFIPAVSRGAGPAMVLDIHLNDGAQHSAKKTVAPDTTLRHGYNPGVFALAPDGGKWSAAKLAASKLNLTPNL